MQWQITVLTVHGLSLAGNSRNQNNNGTVSSAKINLASTLHDCYSDTNKNYVEHTTSRQEVVHSQKSVKSSGLKQCFSSFLHPSYT